MWNFKTKYVCIDTETTGVSRHDYPFGVSICDDTGNTIWYEWEMDVHKRLPKVINKDVRDIERRCKGKELVFHNQTFDLQKLSLVGCKLDWRGKSWDTMYMSHIWNSEAHVELQGRLKELSLIYLDYEDEDQFDLREAVKKARHLVKKFGLDDWAIAPNDTGDDHIAMDMWLPRAIALHLPNDCPEHWLTICSEYGNGDTQRTMLMFLGFMKYCYGEMKPDDPRLKILQREREVSEAIYDMQQQGIPVSQRKAKRLVREATVDINKEIALMNTYSGMGHFNPESPHHMSEALFSKLKFPTSLTQETKTSTKEKPLYKTNKHIRSDLIDWMESSKVTKRTSKQKKFMASLTRYKEAHVTVDYVQQYIDKSIDGVLHPFIKQNGTATTRVSSANPNGQNITKDLRAVFAPKEDDFWYCLDYSQLQLRIFAYVTGERSMIEAFEAGYDFHGFVGSRIFGVPIADVNANPRLRTSAKAVNFGYIFGEGIAKIAKKTDISDIGDILKKNFPNVHSFMESTKAQVRRYGYVTTPSGYRLYCNKPHKGVNYIVQGCEGDIVKQGMVYCHRYLCDDDVNYDASMLFQVHDELIFRFKKPSTQQENKYQGWLVKDLKDLMELPGEEIGMKIPVDIEHTLKNWKETVKGIYQHAS